MCILYGTVDYTAKFRSIALYTDTRCVTALHSYTAIHRHTRYSCTALYLYNLYNHPLASVLGVGAVPCNWGDPFRRELIRVL